LKWTFTTEYYSPKKTERGGKRGGKGKGEKGKQGLLVRI
jgi:hypothetical protein